MPSSSSRQRIGCCKSRCRQLDELAIREIRVHGGGSDLRLVLAREARWQTASQTTAAGQTFHFNLPSEEVFTTPDWPGTVGRLAATRPFRFPGGPLIRDLVLHFENGHVVDFDASKMGIGRATVTRLWRSARRWLRRQLGNHVAEELQ